MSEDPNDQAKPNVFTRLPDGEIVGIFDLIEREKNSGQAEINTSLLQAGDVLAMQYNDPDGNNAGMVFETSKTEWRDLGLVSGHSPAPSISGFLQGKEIGADIVDKEVVLVGSGWGGSMLQPGVIATDRSPVFFIRREGELRMPFINHFDVFRRNEEGDLRPMSPNQLDAEINTANEVHKTRLAQADELMERFGFSEYYDFKNGDRTSEPDGLGRTLQYEDDKYIAQYEAGMAMGNCLAVLDKKTQEWTMYKYYNYKNEDFMQVAYANLEGQDIDKLFLSGRLVEESSVHVSRQAITTHSSSERFGLNVINYKPSAIESRDYLDIPGFANTGEVYSPNVQIFADDDIKVPIEYPLSVIEDKQPGLHEAIQRGVKVEHRDDGRITLTLNGHEIELKNPDSEFTTLVNNIKTDSKPKDATERAGTENIVRRSSRIRRAGQKIGKALRRKDKSE